MAHKQLALANVVAWLDPVYLLSPDEVDTPSYEGDDHFGMALQVCRQLFPAVYAGAVGLLWQEADERILERYLCDGISAHLEVPLNCIDEIGYGVPIAPAGLGIADPEAEFFTRHTDLAVILADFGVTDESDPSDYARGYAVAKVLIADLQTHEGDTYRQLLHLIEWLWGCSGNTYVDYTLDEVWAMELEFPEWSLENIVFLNEIAREARQIITDARAAQQALEQDSALRAAFRQNITVLEERITAGDNRNNRLLDWVRGT